MKTLHVIFTEDQLFLLYQAAFVWDGALQSRKSFLEKLRKVHYWEFSFEEYCVLPREGLSFVAWRSIVLQNSNQALEDTTMKDCDGLTFGVRVFLVGKNLVFVVSILPVDENLVGNQRVVLFIRNLEVPEEF